MQRSTVSIALIFAGVLALMACNQFSPSTPVVQSQATPTTAVTPVAQSTASGDDCSNVLFPAVEGATWTYSVDVSGSSSTRVDTITDVGASSFLGDTKITNANGAVVDIVVTWHCNPDGLRMAQPDGGQFSALGQGSGPGGSGGAKFTTSSNEGVTLPRSVSAGDSWTQTTTGQLTSSLPSFNGPTTSTTQYHAVGPEDVTVPAGTFHCMRIEYTQTMTLNGSSTGTLNAVEWVSPEIGMVKTDNGPQSTVELVSYHIP